LEIAKERVDETKKAYKRVKLNTLIASFGVSLAPPALATSIASALGIGLFAPAGIAAVLSVFSAKALLDWEKGRSVLKKTPWSYVLDVARKI
jgi:hypothetical protein